MRGEIPDDERRVSVRTYRELNGRSSFFWLSSSETQIEETKLVCPQGTDLLIPELRIELRRVPHRHRGRKELPAFQLVSEFCQWSRPNESISPSIQVRRRSGPQATDSTLGWLFAESSRILRCDDLRVRAAVPPV